MHSLAHALELLVLKRIALSIRFPLWPLQTVDPGTLNSLVDLAGGLVVVAILFVVIGIALGLLFGVSLFSAAVRGFNSLNRLLAFSTTLTKWTFALIVFCGFIFVFALTTPRPRELNNALIFGFFVYSFSQFVRLFVEQIWSRLVTVRGNGEKERVGSLVILSDRSKSPQSRYEQRVKYGTLVLTAAGVIFIGSVLFERFLIDPAAVPVIGPAIPRIDRVTLLAVYVTVIYQQAAEVFVPD